MRGRVGEWWTNPILCVMSRLITRGSGAHGECGVWFKMWLCYFFWKSCCMQVYVYGEAVVRYLAAKRCVSNEYERTRLIAHVY